MNKASFTWDSSQSPKLIEIYLNVNAGSLVGIIGAIGSCKSSLLAAILGEMSLIDGSITHHVQFLPEFDHCILLHHGKIERQGLFSELLKIDKVKQAYENHQTHSEENNQRSDSNVYDDDDDFMNPIEIIDKSSIVREETSINGTISGDVWLKLFTSSYGVYDVTNKWLSLWSSKSEVKQREKHYPNIYLGLLICTLILALLRADYFFHVILRGASVLHNNMFKGVLYSSLRFHESNPVGRILNRFSKDQQILDESLPLTFFDTIQLLIMVLGSIVIIGMANPWVLLTLIIIIPAFLWLRSYYVNTSREIKRLESISRSLIYTLFSSTLSGLMTVRAFKVEDDFVNSFIDKVNANTRGFFMFLGSTRWFGIRLDLMTCCLSFLTAMLTVSLRKKMDSLSAALGQMYAINLTDIFQ
ncbi:unnamed protein product [Rotaria sp. Silwood1]|nr:unnamed protein product [Rotaria sp. Silwood1]